MNKLNKPIFRKIITAIIIVLLLVPIIDAAIHYCQGTEDKCEMSCCNENENSSSEVSLSRAMNCNCCSLTETKKLPVQPVIFSIKNKNSEIDYIDVIFKESINLINDSFENNIILQSYSSGPKKYITISVFRI